MRNRGDGKCKPPVEEIICLPTYIPPPLDRILNTPLVQSKLDKHIYKTKN